ncbi:MAG: HAD family hydrolase [Erysipelotrichaceae bacterium]|nr:HAD family hydrolase [Erysipelotrichaceae bacterium]
MHEAFEKQSGLSKEQILEDCLDFYAYDFKNARQFTYENPLAVTAVSTAKTKAGKVILATNPFFPMAAQIVRMGYVGLTPDMFDYISCYEKDRFCKPNPKYLLDLCNMYGLDPEKCLLVGNDVKEDMYCAALTKMDTFLVTDCMIPYEDYSYTGKQGTFADLVKYLESL